jgi:hypothetical protein
VHVSHEAPNETHLRLLLVLAQAEFRVYQGAFAYTEYPATQFPLQQAALALAFVRDEQVWSVLEPATSAALEPLQVFAFHFPPDLDNSGFVGWLASHLKAVLGTGVVVVCGFNGRRGGVFDYWGVPWRVGRDVLREVQRLRGEGARS